MKHEMLQPQHDKLNDLRAATAKLSIEIQYRNLSDSEFSIQSGHCKLNGKDLIILDKGLHDAEQINIILQALKKFDLEDIFVAPWIRDQLENPSPRNRETSNQPRLS